MISMLDPGPDGANVDQVLSDLEALAKLGIQHVHTSLVGDGDVAPIEIFRDRIIPVIADW